MKFSSVSFKESEFAFHFNRLMKLSQLRLFNPLFKYMSFLKSEKQIKESAAFIVKKQTKQQNNTFLFWGTLFFLFFSEWTGLWRNQAGKLLFDVVLYVMLKCVYCIQGVFLVVAVLLYSLYYFVVFNCIKTVVVLWYSTGLWRVLFIWLYFCCIPCIIVFLQGCFVHCCYFVMFQLY